MESNVVGNFGGEMEGSRSTARRGSLVLEYHRGIGRATNPPGSRRRSFKNPARWLRRCGQQLPEGVREGTAGGGGSSRKKTLCARGENPQPPPPRACGSGRVGSGGGACRGPAAALPVLKNFVTRRQWPSSARAAEAQCKGPVGSRLRQIKPRAQESLRITS